MSTKGSHKRPLDCKPEKFKENWDSIDFKAKKPEGMKETKIGLKTRVTYG